MGVSYAKMTFMNFELSEDQEAFREAARELLDARSDRTAVRAVVDAGGGYDAELWKAMVDQGWTGLVVPEESGGLGFGTIEAAVLLEQVGAHLAPAPFLSQLVALDVLVRSGQADQWIEPLLAGSSIAAVAWRSVVAAGSDLNGRTEPVVYGPSADVAIVRSDDAVFLVELSGATCDAEPAMDQTRELGWLDLDGVAAVRLGGAELAEQYLDLGALAHSAEMLGAASAALDMAVEYAKEREQFGRPIGSFQAVKHRCADMLVDVEGMRSSVYYAAWALGAGDPDRSIAASTAKVWCSDASKRVMASALQVHGGIGFTWEHDIHLFLKRAQLDQVSFGDATFHRSRLARLLRQRVVAGDSVI
jgi:alkylation response protein AidB-like acyl-CoA dehydrogenase